MVIDGRAVRTDTRAVVRALEAGCRHDGAGVRRALLAGVEACGWDAIGHRLDVAGRALAFDAGLDILDDREVALVVAELAAAVPWAGAGTVLTAPSVLEAWAGDGGDDVVDLVSPELDLDRLVGRTAVLLWLTERLGYPPQVVA